MFVTRSGRQFSDGKQWLYSCSCNTERLKFLHSLGTKIDCTFSSFSEDFPRCMHVKAVSDLMVEFDALNYISPDLDFAGMYAYFVHSSILLPSRNCDRSFLCSYEYRFKHHCELLCELCLILDRFFFNTTMKFTDSIVQVGSCGDVCLKAETIGVVFLSSGTIITCATCRYGKTTCQHVKNLEQILNDHVNGDTTPEILLPYVDAYHRLRTETPIQKKKYPTLKCISTEKTPFDLPPHLSSILSKQRSARFNIVDGVALLHPHLSLVCPGCGLSNWIKDVATSAKIVTLNSFIPATGSYILNI